MRVTVEGPRLVPMDRIKAANEAAGRCWFEVGAMRFFRSRIAGHGYGANDRPGVVFFVSSEQGPDEVRRYSVRVALDGGARIETAGDFQQFSNGQTATRAAILYAADPSSRPDNVKRLLGQEVADA